MFGIQPYQNPSPAPQELEVHGCDLAMSKVLQGAVGALAGAAVADDDTVGRWAAAGFFLGVTLGQYGIVGVLAASVWNRIGRASKPR